MRTLDARFEGQRIRESLVEQFGNPFGSISGYIEGTDFQEQQARKMLREASRESKRRQQALLADI